MYFYRACQGGSHCILEALLAEVIFFVFSTYTLHYPTQVSHVTVSCLLSGPILQPAHSFLPALLSEKARGIPALTGPLNPRDLSRPHPVQYSYG